MKGNIAIRIIMVFIFALIPASFIANNNATYYVTMHKTTNNQPEHNMPQDSHGRRIPSIPVYCSISQNLGVSLVGLTEDVNSYEIWDVTSEINIASFYEESEFINFIFSHEGEYKIIFRTESYIIFGEIQIE